MLLWNLPCKIKAETLSSSSWSNIRETVMNPKELISSCFSCSKKMQHICYWSFHGNLKDKIFAIWTCHEILKKANSLLCNFEESPIFGDIESCHENLTGKWKWQDICYFGVATCHGATVATWQLSIASSTCHGRLLLAILQHGKSPSPLHSFVTELAT